MAPGSVARNRAGIMMDEASNIPLEKYAEVAAHIRRAGDANRATVLAEYGFTAGRWARISDDWTRAIGEDIDAGGSRLVLAFSEAFERALDAPRSTPRPNDAASRGSHPEVAPEAPSETPRPPVLPSTSLDETAAVDLSVLATSELPFEDRAADPPSPTELEGTHPEVGATAIATAIALDDAPLPFGSEEHASNSIDETAFMTAIDVDEDPLPYEGTRPAPTPVAPHMVPHPQTGSTKHIAVDSAPITTALPFHPVSALGSTRIGHLTIQQIAALEVEIEFGVGRLPEILSAFALNRERYLGLRAELERRLKDAKVRDLFEREKSAVATWRERNQSK